MKKKFCKLSAIFIALIMMFTVVVLPNVEAALPVDVNKKCSLEISISSHSYAEDLSKNDVQVDLYKVASISQLLNMMQLNQRRLGNKEQVKLLKSLKMRLQLIQQL